MTGSKEAAVPLDEKKRFDAWNEKKKVIHTSRVREYVHERGVWWCSLGVNIGDEQDGKHELYERPILVIKKFNDAIVLSVPLTSRTKSNKYHFQIEHEGIPYAVILSQLRLVSTKRLSRRIWRMGGTQFAAIKEEIKRVSL